MSIASLNTMQRISLNDLFRKTILTLLICMGTVLCFGQKKGYDIRVQISDQEGTSIYLQGFYGDESDYIDSCRVKNGTARFKSSALLPDGFYVISDKSEMTSTNAPIY